MRVLCLCVALAAFALVSGCDSHPRTAKTPDPSLEDAHGLLTYESYWGADPAPSRSYCIGPRSVTAWGP